MRVLPVYKEFDSIEQVSAQEAEAFEQTRQHRRAHTATRPRCRWTLTDRQIENLYEWLQRAACSCDFYLKVSVVLTALYLLVEVGSAFLPGGAVGRVLGGVR